MNVNIIVRFALQIRPTQTMLILQNVIINQNFVNYTGLPANTISAMNFYDTFQSTLAKPVTRIKLANNSFFVLSYH